MHSNNSGSHLRRVSASDVNLINPKKKSTVASQTENFPNYGQLCNLQEMSVQEIKSQYEKTLNFMNDCHEYMNEIFTGRFNASRMKPFEFRVPQVPNYFGLLELFLDSNKVENIGKVQEVRTKRELFKDQKWFFDLKIVPDNGDGFEHAVANTQQQEPFPINLKNLSTAFEEIYKTCNTFESKSEDILTKSKPPIKFKYAQEKTKFNPEQGDQALQQKSTIEMIELDESFMESHLSFTESIESCIESDQSLSDFINSESLSNSEPQSSSLIQINPEENGEFVDDLVDKDSNTSIYIVNDCGKVMVDSEAGTSRNSSATVMNQRKSYPFTLSNRDKCRDDIKEIIDAMGIYTENGDIRPNIIKLLDNETALRNSSERVMKFRNKRPLDIQVHYNNQNMRVASEEELLVPSEENLLNLCVSTSTSSSTIISESEIINIPNYNK